MVKARTAWGMLAKYENHNCLHPLQRLCPPAICYVQPRLHVVLLICYKICVKLYCYPCGVPPHSRWLWPMCKMASRFLCAVYVPHTFCLRSAYVRTPFFQLVQINSHLYKHECTSVAISKITQHDAQTTLNEYKSVHDSRHQHTTCQYTQYSSTQHTAMHINEHQCATQYSNT